MLSAAKSRAILWLLIREMPPTIDEWTRATHEGTSRALRESNIIHANERGVELTVFGFGIATGIKFALETQGRSPSMELWPSTKDYPR